MSAFIVSDNHIDVIMTFAVLKHASYYWAEKKERVYITAENASEVGQKLVNENYRSVNYRYRGEFGSPIKYKFKRVRPDNYSAVDVLKAIDSLDYQSCETDDWQDTEARAILDGIQSRMINALPGYDESKGWSL